MNIPLTYSIMGLYDINNFVKYFQTISGNRLNNRTINGVTWNYLEYNSLTTYYKIYGVSHNNGYYTFEVKDNHSSHNLCKQKEEEFINSLKF